MGQGKQRKLNSLQNEIGEPYTQDSRAMLTRVLFENSGKLILAEQSNLNFTDCSCQEELLLNFGTVGEDTDIRIDPRLEIC